MSEPQQSRNQSVGDKLKGGAFKSVKAVGNVFDDFKAFLNKGNVVDLAVGLVMGAAFTAVVTSLVGDLITPLIGLATQSNLENMFYVLRCPKNQTNCRDLLYGTIGDANKAGVVTWNYGRFVQMVINFVIIALIVFFIVKAYSAAFCRKTDVIVKDCVYCCKEIPLDATRCPFCTSPVQIPHSDSDILTKNNDDVAVQLPTGSNYRR
ncbi:hypothetical protein BATDEDRAFT_34461 [Batrachochytrium dendrobatidis JAM81]|uniref:Large conductance mechanosensitive channel protein n=2 Tax=Batrachochytrium dendrobatidis TaxID=109871 RepID=F4NWG6_BATDJ|nr:uncharacterized protein BATDEDRAFT_34461 [Batrachochytrium dendrobatidis JAM81]EGF82475.1 hypothetical protein BATDEDRAFT_34461 [Batrachochytrium dendrobatidis JAM81]KAJ8328050.1 hypothetical protein O5D80_003432 [Batrachochytrium dendrobatidis]KAK5667007.1 hypothetical protein QVD99_006225 [Batrachochytrium dendrobatidis]OAJ39561.1 large conductance mechanosensitive channel protein [Batrachochytrium dendrobatidis JEL423]|eukprot:XP_006676812.1 hypothetical protein BATDEDRAFT_34461 [Batrachochytrium dendrobatidis JAM81]